MRAPDPAPETSVTPRAEAESPAQLPSPAEAEPAWALAAQPALVNDMSMAAVETMAGAIRVEAPEAPPVPANDVTPAPAIQPILIGADSTAPAEPKRGWWRRG